MLLKHLFPRKDRMGKQKNAPLTPRGREKLLRRVLVGWQGIDIYGHRVIAAQA